MRFYGFLWAALVSLLLTSQVAAQTRVVTGRVTDSLTGEVLEQVSTAVVLGLECGGLLRSWGCP